MASRKVKADHRADTRGKPWAGIPHAVLDSLAYLHCDLWERAILIEIVRAMNGYNNGRIAVSQRQIADRLRTSNFRRIGRGIAGLMQKGLIDIEVEGQRRERHAREYRLTFVNTGTNGRFKTATNDYRDWVPEAFSGVEPVSAGTAESAEPVSAEAQKSADPVSAASKRKKIGNPGKAPKTGGPSKMASAEPVSSLIIKPYPVRKKGRGKGRGPLELPSVLRAADFGWWGSDATLRAKIVAHVAMLAWTTDPPMTRGA